MPLTHVLLAFTFTFDQATAEKSDYLRNIHYFTIGGTCVLSLIAALLFLRFYRKTADRLFLFFAIAFAIFGLNRVAFLLTDAPDEARTILYLVRLLAFGIILFAIIDKNRARRPALVPPDPRDRPGKDPAP
jgi:hypothetical protein